MNGVDTYKKFARFYDSYVQGFGADIPLYLASCDPNDAIIEIGCGTGRILKPLLETGHRVTGVDISDEMLELAEKKFDSHITSGNLQLFKHNFVHGPLAKKYDIAFVTFYTFNYILEDSEQASFIKNVMKSLKPGGRILIDLFYPSVLAEPEKADKWQKEKPYFIDGKKVILKDKRMMKGHIEERVQVFMYEEGEEEIATHRRYMDKKSMCRLLANNGCIDIKVTDSYDQAGFHEYMEGEKVSSSFVITASKKK